MSGLLVDELERRVDVVCSVNALPAPVALWRGGCRFGSVL